MTYIVRIDYKGRPAAYTSERAGLLRPSIEQAHRFTTREQAEAVANQFRAATTILEVPA